ncbi:MAG: M12 family metallopeptidase [Chitinophagaceae bacterium]|nr:M12 family metallopeptidase [Chitinophagaceae bacterium]
MRKLFYRIGLRVLIIACIPVSLFFTEKKRGIEKICTEIYIDTSGLESFNVTGAAVKQSLWPHHIEFPLSLGIEFMNGTEFQKRKVQQYVTQWTRATNNKIRFGYRPYDGWPGDREIRITFNAGGGSWSYIGSGARYVRGDEATMNFGWINPQEPEESIKQVILHEFGHAIGLVHEHQSPDAKIPWDSAKVYEYYRNTQNPPWDKEKVDFNVFRRYDASTTNYSKYDSLSIMHYSIPEELTKGDFYVPWNSNLSATDTRFIKDMYRFNPCIPNETCCFDRRGRRIPCP